MKYDFTIVLKYAPELTEELADRLFAAGCDDGSPGMCSGVTTIGCIAARVEIDAQALPAS